MTRAKKYKTAVIGVGNMGRNHLRVYSEIPDIKIIAISDLNLELLNILAEKYQVNSYLDFKEMLERKKPEIVSICVPTSKHYEVAKVCIERNVNVLLEKPIADDMGQAQEILDLAKERNIKFLIGHIERFNPMVKKVKKIIERGRLGRIVVVIAIRVGTFPPQIQDADVAIDLAIHDIDICNYLLGELPVGVKKNGQKNLTKDREDSVEFFLKYNSGASAYIQVNWITLVKRRKLIITGERGYLEADYISQEIKLYENHCAGKISEVKVVPIKREPLKEELSYFVDCVKKNVSIDSQFALDSLKIALHS